MALRIERDWLHGWGPALTESKIFFARRYAPAQIATRLAGPESCLNLFRPRARRGT